MITTSTTSKYSHPKRTRSFTVQPNKLIKSKNMSKLMEVILFYLKNKIKRRLLAKRHPIRLLIFIKSRKKKFKLKKNHK